VLFSMHSTKKVIYQLIYTLGMKLNNLTKNKKSSYERSPTLDTVIMIENTIEKYSGEFTKTNIWKKLPKKVMWQTYLVAIDYLESINKIALDKKGKVGYIWNLKLAKRLSTRKEIKT
jgi:hypothetical protein